MRRLLSAVLLSAITIAVPLASPADADAKEPPKRPAPLVVTAPRLLAVMASASVPVSPPHAHLAHHDALAVLARALHTTARSLRAKWQRVAICEVGGNWKMTGPLYSGIGFANSTWTSYGGTRYAPLAGLATKDQQILIGMKVTGGWVPDQYGCAPGGW